MTSYKVEVLATGEKNYSGNGLRFATKEQAEEYALDLMGRWTAVEQYRVLESEEPVNR